MLQASKTTCQIATFFRREERQASWKKLQGYVLEEEDGGQDTGQVDQVCKSSKVAGSLWLVMTTVSCRILEDSR